MTYYEQNPLVIADSSFTLIRQELQTAGHTIPMPLAALVERIIHSTADFEFASITHTSPYAIEAGVQALQTGCALVTDVHMVRVGISERRLATFGATVHCFVADDTTQEQAASAGVTRSAIGMRMAAERGLLTGGIVVIGNAPTALYEVLHLVQTGIQPALVIGMPVGFISAAESKAALMEEKKVPWIVTAGRKGGSTVAVATVNALLHLAASEPNEC